MLLRPLQALHEAPKARRDEPGRENTLQHVGINKVAKWLLQLWRQAMGLEPISKSSEEENKAGELDESKEVLGVVFPADENAALPLDPRKEAFDEPAAHVAN